MDPLHLEVSDNHDNQPATGATKTGGGWQEGVDKATTRPTTTTVGDNKRQERAADGDGSNEESEDGKGDGDGNEGAGR
jgi:hypothetical protein